MGRLAACLSFAALVAGADALAQATATTPIDLGGKGRISYEDFVHRSAAQALGTLDRDRNQLLSGDEARAAGVNAVEQRNLAIKFPEADLDGDGYLSVEELKSALRDHPEMRAAFDAYDLNGDGTLSEAELGAVPAYPQLSIGF
jgi:Ca2+-binding EF-hand superfamily protein